MNFAIANPWIGRILSKHFKIESKNIFGKYWVSNQRIPYLAHQIDIQKLDVDAKKIMQRDKKECKKAATELAHCAVEGFRIDVIGQGSTRDVEIGIAEELADLGIEPDPENPKQWITMLIYDGLWFGISNRRFDYDKWYSKQGTNVSRAEKKIKEALEVFGVDLKNVNGVLDLGAAPGGWSKVFADLGKRVYAIDPANLNIKHENIIHIKNKAQEVVYDFDWDLLVCDMNMQIVEVSEIIASLPKTTEGIVTIKVFRNPIKDIEVAKNTFENEFEVEILHLAENRREFTAHLLPK